MRIPRAALVVLGLALVTAPLIAAVKAMTLSELMGITQEAALVRIEAKDSFRSDVPFEGAVFTRLTVKGESLRTGEPVSTQVIFLGSHDPADRFASSEMPQLQDTRVGGDAILFMYADASMPGTPYRVASHADVYRVEQAFGAQVVIGKGEGAAFQANLTLAAARDQIRQTHAALKAAPAPAGK
jgi:hypothetical protein